MKIELWQGGTSKSTPPLCTVQVAEDEAMNFIRLMGSQSIQWRVAGTDLESDEM